MQPEVKIPALFFSTLTGEVMHTPVKMLCCQKYLDYSELLNAMDLEREKDCPCCSEMNSLLLRKFETDQNLRAEIKAFLTQHPRAIIEHNEGMRATLSLR